VRKSQLQPFLRGLHAALRPGAKVVFLDNRFVEGSSTPIDRRDEEGNTYQLRRLDDGSSYSVLKNFPSQAALREAAEGLADRLRFHEWPYFWAMEYEVAAAHRF
jgi:demethylmenaquinone methyltransferase/2-methoxy-6-polyprenyl-1,4-benzoquinol methylase